MRDGGIATHQCFCYIESDNILTSLFISYSWRDN